MKLYEIEIIFDGLVLTIANVRASSLEAAKKKAIKLFLAQISLHEKEE